MSIRARWCRNCRCEPPRHGRRDQRCGTCAAYYHLYHRERSETLIIRNNVRRYERTCLQ